MYGYDKKTDSAFHIFVGPLSITGSVVRQEKKHKTVLVELAIKTVCKWNWGKCKIQRWSLSAGRILEVLDDEWRPVSGLQIWQRLCFVATE